MHGRQEHELPAFQARLDRQADALRHLRSPIYEKADLQQAGRILDVGCGSGAVTAELEGYGDVVALDVAEAMVSRAAGRISAGTGLAVADGAHLPFKDDAFDAAVCNLVLLWAPDPGAMVREMARVVRPGGLVLASMEPDYGGKLHWPSNPLVDTVFRGEGVANRGGDPHAGRKLRQWFVAAGLLTDVGISNTQIPTPDQDLQNFRRNRTYYRRLLLENGFNCAQVDDWEDEYLAALDEGIVLCFLPLLHAIGRVPARPVGP